MYCIHTSWSNGFSTGQAKVEILTPIYPTCYMDFETLFLGGNMTWLISILPANCEKIQITWDSPIVCLLPIIDLLWKGCEEDKQYGNFLLAIFFGRAERKISDYQNNCTLCIDSYTMYTIILNKFHQGSFIQFS